MVRFGILSVGLIGLGVAAGMVLSFGHDAMAQQARLDLPRATHLPLGVPAFPAALHNVAAVTPVALVAPPREAEPRAVPLAVAAVQPVPAPVATSATPDRVAPDHAPREVRVALGTADLHAGNIRIAAFPTSFDHDATAPVASGARLFSAEAPALQATVQGPVQGPQVTRAAPDTALFVAQVLPGSGTLPVSGTLPGTAPGTAGSLHPVNADPNLPPAQPAQPLPTGKLRFADPAQHYLIGVFR